MCIILQCVFCICADECEIVFNVTNLCLTTFKQHSGTSLLPHSDTGWFGTVLNYLEAGHINLLAHERLMTSNITQQRSSIFPCTQPAEWLQLHFLCFSALIKSNGLLVTDICNVDIVRIYTIHSIHTLGNSFNFETVHVSTHSVAFLLN